MLQVVKNNYVDKLKETLSDAAIKLFEAPASSKKTKYILNKISPIFAETITHLETTIKKLEKDLQEYKWQHSGECDLFKYMRRQIGQQIEHLKRIIKENKEKDKIIKGLTIELNKTTKQRDRFKNRLYKLWNRLKKWLKKRSKKKIRKYTDKKKVQLLKLERKVKK